MDKEEFLKAIMEYASIVGLNVYKIVKAIGLKFGSCQNE